jgi:hypothetical protein
MGARAAAPWTMWIGGLLMLLLTGCANRPVIESERFAAPKTVVIHDIPDLNPVATIGIVLRFWPQSYFSPGHDRFVTFQGGTPTVVPYPGSGTQELVNQQIVNQIATAPRPMSPGAGAAVGAAGGLVGGLIEFNAAKTEARAAAFPSLVRRATGNADWRTDFVQAVKTGLEGQGVQVTLASETRNMPHRLRWPATDADGKPIPTGALAGSPPIDADLLVQVSPIALYAAPGPLNSYGRVAGVAVALFDGRSRSFLGWQAIPFDPPFGQFSYPTYDELVADLDKAAPALQEALMSLVPQVVAIVSKRPPPGATGR